MAEASTLSVAGEYLYFKPIINGYYALPHSIVIPVQGTRLAAHYDFSSGYRVEGIYSFFCEQVSARFRWSSLRASHKSSTSGIFVEFVNIPDFAPNTPFTNVNAQDSLTFDYDACDALVGWRFCERMVRAALCLGVHYIKISNEQMDTYSGTLLGLGPPRPLTVSVLWSTEARGIGPELALFGEYLLPKIGCLPRIELLGSLQVGALVVNNEIDNKNSVTVEPLSPASPISIRVFAFNFTNDEIQRIIPFWDLRLGLGSNVCLGPVIADISLGYEIVAYYDLLDRVILEGFLGPTFDFYNDLYLHGLFVRLGVSY